MSCRISYSDVSYLYVSFSGLIMYYLLPNQHMSLRKDDHAIYSNISRL